MNDQSKTRITVEIYGQRYTIVGQTSKKHMEEVASYIDRKMRELASRNPSLDTTRLAVLTAVNLADENIQLHHDFMELESMIDELETESLPTPTNTEREKEKR